MPKSQLNLTAALAALIVLVVAIWGVAAERRLRRAELDRVARSLEQRAALVAQQVDPARVAARDVAALDALADRAGRAAGARVTVIAADGVVLGDSEVPRARLAALENHAGRPEVRAALAGRVGHDTRRSATVGRELFYLALPLQGGAVVRLAVDLSDLDAAVAGLRRDLAAAGALALAIGLALSYAFSWLTLRPLREMRRVAASIAEGHLDDRLPFGTGDELSDLAHAINRMAEQLRAQLDEATHEKEQLRAVLESMVEGVLVLDARGQVLLANSRLREFFGAPADLVGRPLLEAIRSANLDEVLRSAAASQGPVSEEVTLEQPRPRTLRVHAVRFDSGDELRTGTVAVFHDISELMRLEEVRRDFVANASHELQTPLAAIRGFAETLLASPSLPDADRVSYLEVIERHARRLGNIVRDLLELSTLESRKLRLAPGAVEVEKLAAELVRDARLRCEERQLSIEIECAGDPQAFTDPRALEQVLTNLLDNAIKYTEPGGRIALRIGGDAERMRVEVRDSGIGIPPQDLGRIFERFYRVDRARSRALGGTGLGLAIVKHLVQGMGGEIFVTSELGVGSRFAFTLPRSRP
jgi:two-component system, OmpR family, phosphate regulon sensor histidine kinase PhoR